MKESIKWTVGIFYADAEGGTIFFENNILEKNGVKVGEKLELVKKQPSSSLNPA